MKCSATVEELAMKRSGRNLLLKHKSFYDESLENRSTLLELRETLAKKHCLYLWIRRNRR